MLSKRQRLNRVPPHDHAVPPPKRMGLRGVLPFVPHFKKGGLGGIFYSISLFLAGPAAADVHFVATPSTP